MTTTAVRVQEKHVRAVNEANKAKDVLILAAVWRAWAEHRPAPTVRELAALIGNASTAPTYARVYKLRRQGWLQAEWLVWQVMPRSLIPGPRFVGLDHGIPLERKQ